jgi:hypothetical protein
MKHVSAAKLDEGTPSAEGGADSSDSEEDEVISAGDTSTAATVTATTDGDGTAEAVTEGVSESKEP